MAFSQHPTHEQNDNIVRLRELADDLGAQWREMFTMTTRLRHLLLRIRGASTYDAIQTLIREAESISDAPE